MKKHYLMMAAAMLMLASCGNPIDMPDVESSPKPEPEPEKEYVLEGDMVLSATVEDLTKVVADESSQSWELSDVIAVSDGTKLQSSKNTQAGQIGKFPVSLTKGTKQLIAFYPYSAAVKIEGTKVRANIPTAQNVGEYVSPLVAKATSAMLYFTNLAAKISFTVDMDGVKEVKVISSEAIAGDVVIDFSADVPTVSATAKEVVLKGNFIKGESYSVAVAATTVGSCEFELSDGREVIAHASFKNLELSKGTTVSVGRIIEDVPTYSVTHMWIYGGTGPEYGGGKVYDMLQKEEFFNNEDGRGILAIKDNFFELRHDGKFYNWAGEDARNWWMVYSGAHNPVNGKDIDLTDLYDMIPRHEATYSVDNNGIITFTTAEGKVSKGQILPAGEHAVSDYGHTITVEKIGIAFQFTGGHDDWNNMYSEYNAIACRPHIMVVELEPKDVTFHAPEAALTIDKDFKYVAPVEPDKRFDFDNWPGSWNVRGGNSSPFGIWVLGGTGDDPAFISPIDKSWDWNDSIWKESDNGLVIEVTGRTDKEIKGTTNYWAGADGGFWDYTWNATGEDLSEIYGRLPHGKYEFTLNLETFEITFGNGKKAKFLEPGEHTFIHGKTLSIPDGMFAFNFETGTDDMENPTSSRWTDIDRFVYGPRNYVMIFEKE